MPIIKDSTYDAPVQVLGGGRLYMWLGDVEVVDTLGCTTRDLFREKRGLEAGR